MLDHIKHLSIRIYDFVLHYLGVIEKREQDLQDGFHVIALGRTLEQSLDSVQYTRQEAGGYVLQQRILPLQ